MSGARRRNRLEEHAVEIDGMTLNVGVGGVDDGPVLLLLHGLAARWQAFGSLLPALGQRYRLIAPDFRGHGASGHAPGSYTLDRMVADTRALLRAEAPDEPVAIYGHSLGGWIALWLAADHGDLVRGVVVADTAIEPGKIDPAFAVSYLADLPLALKSLATSMQLLDPAVMEEFRSDLLVGGYDPVALLGQVSCPLLLLQADPAEGGLMSNSDVALVHALAPGAGHVFFDGIGHGMHMQDSSRVIDVVEPFLADLR